MKLSKNDPLIRDLPTGVTETLPDPNLVAENLGGSPTAQAVLKSQYAFDNTQIFQEASQVAFGGIVSGLGAPTILFEALTDALEFDVQRAAVEVLEQIYGTLENALSTISDASVQALKDGIDAGVGVALDTATTAAQAVPVIGLVIQIAWGVGKLIFKVAKIIKEQGKDSAQILYPKSKFDPIADRDTLNLAVLGRLRASTDWSEMFFPPGLGYAHQWQGPFGVTPLEAGGTRIISNNPLGLDGVGFVPGTAMLHQSIEILNGQVTEAGTTLLPSSRQHCLWLWRNITNTNSPSTFTVDCVRVLQKWQRYIDELRVFLNETDLVSPEDKKKVFSFYNEKDGVTIFGWGDGSKEQDTYQPALLAHALRTRQFALLDTVTCAYIDESFGAVQDAQVRVKWELRRKELLDHPAICTLDLGNIPDPVYRFAVEERLKAFSTCGMQGAPQDIVLTPRPEPLPTVPDGLAAIPYRGVGDSNLEAIIGIGAVLALGGVAYVKRQEIVDALRRFRGRRGRRS